MTVIHVGRPHHGPAAVVTVLAATALLCTACGAAREPHGPNGSGGSAAAAATASTTPGASPGGPPGSSPGTVSTSSTPAGSQRGPQSATAGPTVSTPVTPAAPATLVVAALMTPALLKASGLASVRVEDDGGAGQQGTFSSQARTIAGDGTQLVLDLTSYADPADATSAYQQGAAGTPKPLTGVGDQAATDGQTAYVRKGSQLLTVQATLSAAAEQKLIEAKEKYGSVPTSVYAASASDAAALATAVGRALTGEAATAGDVALPSGAIDPCFTLAGLAALGISGATEQNVTSEDPPAQQCSYSLGAAGSLQVQTLTSTQAAAAVPATSLRDVFDKKTPIGAPASAGGRTAAGSPPLFVDGALTGRNVGAKDDLDLVVYLDPAVDSMMEVYEEPSGSFHAQPPDDDCEQVMRYLLDNFATESGVDPLAPGAAQEYNDALAKLTQACHDAAGG